MLQQRRPPAAPAPWPDHFERTVAKRSVERKNTVLLNNEQPSFTAMPSAAVLVQP
jgi:hypothetical protein